MLFLLTTDCHIVLDRMFYQLHNNSSVLDAYGEVCLHYYISILIALIMKMLIFAHFMQKRHFLSLHHNHLRPFVCVCILCKCNFNFTFQFYHISTGDGQNLGFPNFQEINLITSSLTFWHVI